jgi:hypothetical protein
MWGAERVVISSKMAFSFGPKSVVIPTGGRNFMLPIVKLMARALLETREKCGTRALVTLRGADEAP